MIPAPWISRLASDDRRDVVLLTLSLDGMDPTADTHLAWHPQSVRVGTAAAHADYSEKAVTIPFVPALAQRPVISRTLDLATRTANIANAAIEVSGLSGLARLLKERSSGNRMTARLDLWQHGMDLADVLPLCMGEVTDVTWDRIDGPVSMTIVDGSIDESLTYPARSLSPEDFPGAPARVTGGGRVLQSLTGVNPGRIEVFPIDENGEGESSRFFIVSPPLTGDITRVERSDGVPVEDWITPPRKTPTREDYSELILSTPVPAGVAVYIVGGRGIEARDPYAFLVGYAGKKLSDRAKALIASSPIAFSALIGAEASVDEILRDRFTRQTPFVSTYRLGRFDLIDTRVNSSGGQRWAIGEGLLYRMPTQNVGAQLSPVYNDFTFHIGRTADTRTATKPSPLAVIRRSSTEGPREIRELLAQSESIYGKRPLPKPYPAPDILVETLPDGRPIGSASGQALADAIATAFAFPRRSATYKAERLRGMLAELGDAAILYDAKEEIDGVVCPIVGITYSPTGPELTFGLPTTGEIE